MRTIDTVKHEGKRQAILAAAERCFIRSGFRGASISDICAEAAMSPGHLYHYFDNKESIVAAMTDVEMRRITAEFETLVDALNVVTALIALFNTRLRLKRDGHMSTLLLEIQAEASRNPAIAAILRAKHDAMQTLLADLLRTGQARGQVDPGLEPEPAAAVLFSLMRGAMSMARDAAAESGAAENGAKIDQLRELVIARFLSPDARTMPAAGVAADAPPDPARIAADVPKPKRRPSGTAFRPSPAPRGRRSSSSGPVRRP